MANRRELSKDDPNYAMQNDGSFNSSDDDDQDNLDFAANERGMVRNDESNFLAGSQENHGQEGDSNTPMASVSDQ